VSQSCTAKKTFGKGSVQTLEEFDFGVLKITTAHWFTPKGTSIDKEGIKPDTEVKLTDEDFDANRDPQLEAALKASQN
jgi:carboxyl-terminal processing protease